MEFKKVVEWVMPRPVPVLFYRNFRPFTRTADYPHLLIFAKRRKKNQQITHTGG